MDLPRYFAQGNGEQAGVGTLGGFQAVFRGSFAVSAAAQITFNFFSDDRWNSKCRTEC